VIVTAVKTETQQLYSGYLQEKTKVSFYTTVHLVISCEILGARNIAGVIYTQFSLFRVPFLVIIPPFLYPLELM
jgi:hypothetical protein